jgi:hypothetical protein
MSRRMRPFLLNGQNSRHAPLPPPGYGYIEAKSDINYATPSLVISLTKIRYLLS